MLTGVYADAGSVIGKDYAQSKGYAVRRDSRSRKFSRGSRVNPQLLHGSFLLECFLGLEDVVRGLDHRVRI